MSGPNNWPAHEEVLRDAPPSLHIKGNDERIVAFESLDRNYPPVFRGEDEIRLLRDWCDAWLDEHADGTGEADAGGAGDSE